MIKEKLLIAGVAATFILSVNSFGAEKVVAPDNSAVNERDRQSNELTADDQGTSDSDREVTRGVRQGIVKNKKLSTYAHNLKIISNDGVVTLKGPVRSQHEINTVLDIAKAANGSKKVVNELTIVSAE